MLFRSLMEKGVPEQEIAFIHDANTELRKAELFAKVRSCLLYTSRIFAPGYNRKKSLAHCSVRWFGTTNNDFWHSPRPVSYTHLDVYKRQRQAFA